MVDEDLKIFLPAIFNSEPLKLHLDLKDAAPKLRRVDPEVPEFWVHLKDCIILFQRIMPIVERLIKPKISKNRLALYNAFLTALQNAEF